MRLGFLLLLSPLKKVHEELIQSYCLAPTSSESRGIKYIMYLDAIELFDDLVKHAEQKVGRGQSLDPGRDPVNGRMVVAVYIFMRLFA